MRMNLLCGRITLVSRLYQDRFSISAASSSAFGTAPSAARVISVIKGVHIHVSTINTAGNAHAREPRKSIVMPKSPLIK